MGKALVTAAVRFTRERGASWVMLRTFARNQGALAFWTELGFEPRIVQLTAPVGDLEARGS